MVTAEREPVHLISRWPLRNGMNEALAAALATLVDEVQRLEPHTKSYAVSVGAYDVDPKETRFGRLPDVEQQMVTFEEIYADREAFEEHLAGDPFNKFRAEQLVHFYEDPTQAGWPAATTTFLAEISSTHR